LHSKGLLTLSSKNPLSASSTSALAPASVAYAHAGNLVHFDLFYMLVVAEVRQGEALSIMAAFVRRMPNNWLL
jgi:hypothetical protein